MPATIRSALMLAAVLLALLGSAPAAHAHAHLTRSTPPANARLKQTPAEVGVWFSEKLEPAFSSVEVEGPDGKRLDTGDSRVARDDPKHLTVGVSPGGPGTYRVVWRATSVDTHKTDGSFTFEVAP